MWATPIAETSLVGNKSGHDRLDNASSRPEPRTTERWKQALERLRNKSPALTEWWAVRLLLVDRRGDADANPDSDGLLEKQQPDGHWDWLTNDTSDALATGMAFYALSRHNCEKNQRAISNDDYFPDHKPNCQRSMESTRDQENNSRKTNPRVKLQRNPMGSHWAVRIRAVTQSRCFYPRTKLDDGLRDNDAR